VDFPRDLARLRAWVQVRHEAPAGAERDVEVAGHSKDVVDARERIESRQSSR
jgi:hypothetical protein